MENEYKDALTYLKISRTMGEQFNVEDAPLLIYKTWLL